MTLKDIIAREQPDSVNDDYGGGVCGCPRDYDILDKYKYKSKCDGFYENDASLCTKCWNQEVKVKMKNKEKYAEELIEMMINGDRIAVVNGEPKDCSITDCQQCLFLGGVCGSERSKWAEAEYIESKVFTDEEKTILGALDSEFNYIARNSNGSLWAYSAKPEKEATAFHLKSSAKMCVLYFKKDLFKQIKWEDEEPTNIADVIRRSEKNEE